MKTRHLLPFLALLSTNAQAQEFDWAGQMGANGNQNGRAIVTDATGHAYHAGYFISGIDLDPTAGVDEVIAIGMQDGYLIKQDNDGNYVYGLHFRGNCLPNALALAADGSVLVYGTFTGTVDMDPGVSEVNVVAPSSTWYFLCSLSADGTYQWSRIFGCDQPVYNAAMAIGQNGNIHLTGTFQGTMDADPGTDAGDVFELTSIGGNDVFITTLDAEGNFIRATSFGSSGDDRGCALATDPNNNLYATGYFAGSITIDPLGGNIALDNSSGANYCDAFVAKMDPNGVALWAFAFGGPGYDRGMAITTNAAEEVFVAGSAANNADLDPGPEQFLNTGYDAAFYAKYNADGSFAHAAMSYYGNLSDAQARSIGLDAWGRIYMAGVFNGFGVDFDPGAGNTNYNTAGGSQDGFVAAYSENGEYLWSAQVGGLTAGQELVQGMAVDAAGSTYLTGEFSAELDADPGAGTFLLTPTVAGYTDAFVLKLDPFDLGLVETNTSASVITIDPATGRATFTPPSNSGNAWVRFLAMDGRCLQSRLMSSGSSIDAPFLPAGTYLIDVVLGGVHQCLYWVRQ